MSNGNYSILPKLYEMKERTGQEVQKPLREDELKVIAESVYGKLHIAGGNVSITDKELIGLKEMFQWFNETQKLTNCGFPDLTTEPWKEANGTEFLRKTMDEMMKDRARKSNKTETINIWSLQDAIGVQYHQGADCHVIGQLLPTVRLHRYS